MRRLLLSLLLIGPSFGTPFAQDSIVFYDPAEPPSDLNQFVDQADAVVAVAITEVASVDDPAGRYPLTLYTADVLEVLKPHHQLALVTKLQFLEVAGERRTTKGITRTVNPASLKAREEAVVFLRWAQTHEQFALLTGGHGVYINSTKGLRPALPDSQLGRQWRGRTKGELLLAVKTSASRKK